ncbi:MAG: right-handed parallel beta-helix repeat-containing protein, partial [Armatimonadota bacterium]|nr:right-handed parallel beta-helix repeat-containing protein [Armatimonadota bacterium]
MKVTALFLGGLCLTVSAAHALTLHVAPNGKDTWSGRQPQPNRSGTDGPLATLSGARDAIRRLKQQGGLPVGGVTVELQGGTYEMAQTVALGAEDSGTEAAPIVYRAQPGQEVRLTGAKAITGFSPTTDPAVLKHLPPEAHGKVVQADLKAQGITDYGKLTRRGFGNPMHESHLELFFRDQPMTLARWPNGDTYARIAALPAGQEGQSFVYEGDRPSRWVDEPDPWVFGYWYHDWADEYIPIEKIDPATKTITLPLPKPKFGFRNKQRWYALNLLSELDEPGEWYLDRATGILYFWPPAPVEQGRVTVSLLSTLLSLKDVAHVSLRGLILEGTRGTAVTISGGNDNALIACTLRNIGNRGVTIGGGARHGVVGCDIYRTSDGGISLSGGDRKTLTPAGHY